MSMPVTRIGTPTSDTDRLRMRGRDTLNEVVGVMSYTETFYFIITGQQPTAGQTRCLDACLTILMDHGITPNALVARLVADAVPDDIQVPMAAGLLMVGSRTAGTMVGSGALIAEGLKAGGDPHAWAAAKIAALRAARRRLPGFGHSYYDPTDPRADRLFQIAAEAGEAEREIAMIKIIGEEADKAYGRHLTLNVTGAIGALLCGIGLPVPVMRGVAVVSRAAGLVAHIHEETSSDVAGAAVEFVNGEIAYADPE